MAKRKYVSEFRKLLTDKLMDFGNLIIVAMAVGQLVQGSNFSIGIFISGIVLTIACYIVSYTIIK